MVHIWVTAHIWARVCQVSTNLGEQTRLRETTTGRAHSHAGVHIWMRDRGSSLAGGAHLGDGTAGDEPAWASTHIWVSAHLGEVCRRGDRAPRTPAPPGPPRTPGCRNGRTGALRIWRALLRGVPTAAPSEPAARQSPRWRDAADAGPG